MPIFVRHDHGVADLAAMAANAGAYATNHENLHDNLALDQFALAQQEADDHARQRRDEQILHAASMILTDRRQREANELNNATRVDVAGLNGQNAMDRTQVTQAGANQRTSYNADAANRRADARNQIVVRNTDANIASREGIAANHDALGYYRTDAQAQRDADRAEERRALESFKTLQQQQRRGVELDVSTRRNVIQAELRELASLRNINERRARDPNSSPEEKNAAAARIGPINDEVQKRIRALGTLAPQAQVRPSAPATPYDAQQPGMAQPAPDMSGIRQQETAAPGPQSMAPPPPVMIHPQTGKQFRLRGVGEDGQPVYEVVA